MPGEARQGEIQRHGCVRRDAALHGGVRDIALMPQRHVLHRRHDGGADEAGEAAEVFGQHRVALVRHGGAALLPGVEELLRLAHLGALQMPHFGRQTLDARGDHAQRGEERGVAVARDHLGGDRLGGEPQLLRHVFLHARVDMREGADRARDGAGGDLGAGGEQAGLVAGELGVMPGELQAEAGRLGMDAVAAADGEGVLMLDGARSSAPPARGRYPPAAGPPPGSAARRSRCPARPTRSCPDARSGCPHPRAWPAR